MLAVHLTILACTALVILYTDHLGFRYFRGREQVLSAASVYRLHYAVWVGLLGMLATGAYMAWPALPILLTLPLFQLKMGFVAALFINALCIGFFIKTATVTPYDALTWQQKAPLLISGAVSTVSWIGAVTAAILFFG